MLRSPGELRRKVKTWLLFNKYTNVVMVDRHLQSIASADAVWHGHQHDGRHSALKEEGYNAVAAQRCKQVITDWLLSTRRKVAAMEATPEAKKLKMDSAGQKDPQSKAGTSSRKVNQPVMKGRKGNQPVMKGRKGNQPVMKGRKGNQPVMKGRKGKKPVMKGRKGNQPVMKGRKGNQPVKKMLCSL
jgi:hypothetical protein